MTKNERLDRLERAVRNLGSIVFEDGGTDGLTLAVYSCIGSNKLKSAQQDIALLREHIKAIEQHTGISGKCSQCGAKLKKGRHQR